MNAIESQRASVQVMGAIFWMNPMQASVPPALLVWSRTPSHSQTIGNNPGSEGPGALRCQTARAPSPWPVLTHATLAAQASGISQQCAAAWNVYSWQCSGPENTSRQGTKRNSPLPASNSLITRSNQPLVSQFRHPDTMSGPPASPHHAPQHTGQKGFRSRERVPQTED
ncbi:hypothetical protein NQZ68_013089 [Dissostichus eleginoides]|nr:hypothetical protein NQZ68_013089 [Dissostichus eleginoides]